MSTVRELINKLLVYPPEETIAYLLLSTEDAQAMSDDCEIQENIASRALGIVQVKFNKREGSILDVLGKAVLQALREEEEAKTNQERYKTWLQ